MDEIKCSDGSNLREKGFIPVELTGQGTRSIQRRDSEQRGLRGVGHMPPKVKKQRALDARILMLAFRMQSRPLALGVVLPTIKPGPKLPAYEFRASLEVFQAAPCDFGPVLL